MIDGRRAVRGDGGLSGDRPGRTFWLEWDLARATWACEIDLRVEGEQERRCIAHGGGSGEIASERGAIANQRRGEERDPLADDWGRVAPESLDFGERESGADFDSIGGIVEDAEFGQRLQTNEHRPAAAAQISFHGKICRAGDEACFGM